MRHERELPYYYLLPDHLREGMRRYVEEGLQPGGFLQAVLRNDFVDAVGHADAVSFLALYSIATFLLELPPQAWGSEAKVKAWKGIPDGK